MHTVAAGSIQSLIKHPNRVAIAGGTLQCPTQLLQYRLATEGLALRSEACGSHASVKDYWFRVLRDFGAGHSVSLWQI